MMKKIKLINLPPLDDVATSNHFPSFFVDGYEFCSLTPVDRSPVYVYTPAMALRDNRIHKQNAFVQFSHRQMDSILYKGGMVWKYNRPTQKRKFIEDILLLGSLLTSSNWYLYSGRKTSSYPITPTNKLRTISKNHIEVAQDLAHLVLKIKDPVWQNQFNNGFHLRLLLNTSNINNLEARFLSMVVIWEFLYCKFFGSESQNLQEIMKSLLELFWEEQVNGAIFLTHKVDGVSKNVYYVLRNQLAHSGKLPIDRPYAEQWMRDIPTEHLFGTMAKGVGDYLRFFDELTEVVVMKSMDLHPENRELFNVFNFGTNLSNFLSTGRL